MKLLSLLCLLVLVTFVSSCEQEKSNTEKYNLDNKRISTASIVNGVDVQSDDLEAKSTVAIYDKSFFSFCTGVLVDKRYVLTAAHCVKDININFLILGFGLKNLQHNPSAKVDLVNIADEESHPEYLLGRSFPDIAVIKLAQDAPDGYLPVEMSEYASDIEVGVDFSIAGYGKTKNQKIVPNLRKALVRVNDVKLLESNSSFKYTKIGHGGGCNGDSGAPAYRLINNKLVLIGILSGGDDANCMMANGILSSIPHNIKWIKSTIEKLNQN
ncbi:MAG: S1 family peptidase [Bdellovibrionota bacterium]